MGADELSEGEQQRRGKRPGDGEIKGEAGP